MSLFISNHFLFVLRCSIRLRILFSFASRTLYGFKFFTFLYLTVELKWLSHTELLYLFFWKFLIGFHYRWIRAQIKHCRVPCIRSIKSRVIFLGQFKSKIHNWIEICSNNNQNCNYRLFAAPKSNYNVVHFLLFWQLIAVEWRQSRLYHGHIKSSKISNQINVNASIHINSHLHRD